MLLPDFGSTPASEKTARPVRLVFEIEVFNVLYGKGTVEIVILGKKEF